MKNGKQKTNTSNSSNSWSKKTNLLPSFQGGAGGRLSYSLPFREGPGVGFSPRERLTSTKHTAWGGDDEGEGEQCARGG